MLHWDLDILAKRQPANPFLVFDIDVCEKGGNYFPVSICPSKVFMLDAMKIKGKDQELINVQNNIVTSRKEDPPRGLEMIMDKMNIKYDDRQYKMNDTCYTPNASSARRTASATSQVQHLSKENSECYQQELQPQVNAECYQQRASSSASQESSVPKHYHFEHNREPSKYGTSSATAVTVPSKSEYESGTERHHHQISYTVFFRTFTGFLPNVQLFFRTRRFPLDCSMSYPIRSSVHRNGTYPILKTFLQYLRYRRFEGVEAPEGCENVA